jgi:tryptophan-rich sensory protein
MSAPPRNPWIVLAGLIGLCLAAGVLGAIATQSAVATWYPTLVKPSWTPPSWVFPPVWTALYILMAFAAWLVWKSDTRFAGVRVAMILFFIQLALNALWSPLFFGLRSPGLALIDMALLVATLALTVWAFLTVRPSAGLLMLPYLAWLLFAAALNAAVWRMN